MSPMQLTLAWLRERGYTAEKTEHWNHYAKRRIDLFGFVDVLALSDNHLLAIQTSDGSVDKILSLPAARLLAHHFDVEIWSWRLALTGERRKDGLLNRKKEWKLRRDSLTNRLRSEGTSQ